MSSPRSPDDVVRLDRVSRSFGTGTNCVRALESVEMSVSMNEFVSIIGPSGCGKSTLLSLIAGMIAPTSGDVWVMGEKVRGPRADVGMMLQRATLLDWRTVEENVLLPLQIRHGRRAAKAKVSHERAADLLESVGLCEFARAYPHQLSGGMQQRVAICRMLIADPSVLLLDEPFGALDEFTREEMNQQLEAVFAAQGKAAVFVTHSIQEAVFLSDRVVVMTGQPGRVAGVLDVRLPRPRVPELMTASDFQGLVARARRYLYSGAEDEKASGLDDRAAEAARKAGRLGLSTHEERSGSWGDAV